MGMSLTKDANQVDPKSFKETFETIIQTLEKKLKPIGVRRKSSKKARLKLTKFQHDKAKGLLPDLSRDMRKLRAEEIDALYVAWAEGGLDARDSELEELKLAARRLRDLLPAVKAAEATEHAKVEAAKADELKVADVRGKITYRLWSVETKIAELEKDVEFVNAAEQVAAGERRQFWQPGSGKRPPIQPFESEEAHQARCRAADLDISIADLHILEEDYPKEVEVA